MCLRASSVFSSPGCTSSVSPLGFQLDGVIAALASALSHAQRPPAGTGRKVKACHFPHQRGSPPVCTEQLHHQPDPWRLVRRTQTHTIQHTHRHRHTDSHSYAHTHTTRYTTHIHTRTHILQVTVLWSQAQVHCHAQRLTPSFSSCSPPKAYLRQPPQGTYDLAPHTKLRGTRHGSSPESSMSGVRQTQRTSVQQPCLAYPSTIGQNAWPWHMSPRGLEALKGRSQPTSGLNCCWAGARGPQGHQAVRGEAT